MFSEDGDVADKFLHIIREKRKVRYGKMTYASDGHTAENFDAEGYLKELVTRNKIRNKLKVARERYQNMSDSDEDSDDDDEPRSKGPSLLTRIKDGSIASSSMSHDAMGRPVYRRASVMEKDSGKGTPSGQTVQSLNDGSEHHNSPQKTMKRVRLKLKSVRQLSSLDELKQRYKRESEKQMDLLETIRQLRGINREDFYNDTSDSNDDNDDTSNKPHKPKQVYIEDPAAVKAKNKNVKAKLEKMKNTHQLNKRPLNNKKVIENIKTDRKEKVGVSDKADNHKPKQVISEEAKTKRESSNLREKSNVADSENLSIKADIHKHKHVMSEETKTKREGSYLRERSNVADSEKSLINKEETVQQNEEEQVEQKTLTTEKSSDDINESSENVQSNQNKENRIQEDFESDFERELSPIANQLLTPERMSSPEGAISSPDYSPLVSPSPTPSQEALSEIIAVNIHTEDTIRPESVKTSGCKVDSRWPTGHKLYTKPVPEEIKACFRCYTEQPNTLQTNQKVKIVRKRQNKVSPKKPCVEQESWREMLLHIAYEKEFDYLKKRSLLHFPYYPAIKDDPGLLESCRSSRNDFSNHHLHLPLYPKAKTSRRGKKPKNLRNKYKETVLSLRSKREDKIENQVRIKSGQDSNDLGYDSEVCDSTESSPEKTNDKRKQVHFNKSPRGQTKTSTIEDGRNSLKLNVWK